MKTDSCIGIFDSGLGGISVMRELIPLVPRENMIYYADSGNCPYGEKGSRWIIDRSTAITEFLIRRGAKMVLVACNTATTAAIGVLRARFDIPFVGIEPAIKPAVKLTRSGKIGVLATKGALSSEFYAHTRERFAQGVEVISVAGSGLAELVDEGRVDDPRTDELLRDYIEPMVRAGVDTLVLGCTHYPFLQHNIQRIAPGIQVIDPAPAVARQAYHVLMQQGLESDSSGTHFFYTSGDAVRLKLFLEKQYIDFACVEYKEVD